LFLLFFERLGAGFFATFFMDFFAAFLVALPGVFFAVLFLAISNPMDQSLG
jgi:hypothetical protein